MDIRPWRWFRKAASAEVLTWSKLLGADMGVKSGVTVSIDTALRTATVLACARVLAEGIAQLPLKIYREAADGKKEVAIDHPVHKLLSRAPNEFQSSFEFRETMMFHAVLAKGGYAFKNVVRGELVELLPLVPACIKVVNSNNEIRYEYTLPDGALQVFSREQVFVVRGPSWNGYEGLDMVQQAREAIGLAIATEETHARLHQNGARPGGILHTDAKLDDATYKRLKEQWTAHREGLGNAFKTAVLDNGLKWTPLNMTGVDSQHIETRKHQIEEVCRALRVFPQMIGHSDKTATFASAEAFFLAHVTHSLMPWASRWEGAILGQLLDPKKDAALFPKFNFTALLRGDAKSRAAFYQAALGGARPETAFMTRDEVRALEDLDPLGGEAAELPKPAPALAPAPPTNPAKAGLSDHEIKIGRVLSGANERRIRNARDELDTVLSTLPAEEPDDGQG